MPSIAATSYEAGMRHVASRPSSQSDLRIPPCYDDIERSTGGLLPTRRLALQAASGSRR
jgi:hypothetical protein